MKEAVSAVRQRGMSVSGAAREFDVPRGTLRDHVKTEHTVGKPGHARDLTDDEENGLANYLMYMAKQGFPLNRGMARCYILEIVRRNGRKTRFNTDLGPSDKWFRSFLNRHPVLSEKQPEALERSRARMSNQSTVDRFFKFYEDVLHEHQLQDKPHRIYNCDESGWTGKDRRKGKVIGGKNSHTYRQNVTHVDHVTAHLCVSADGRFLPTMIIYQKSLPHRNYSDGVPDSWLYGVSESGYMDGELFYKWFVRVFVPNCGKERPVLLVMDNHDSHVTLQVVEEARKEGIVLVGLPAHTTHFLQPLDVKIIGPLKARFASMAVKLSFAAPHTTVGKAKFAVVLNYAIDNTTPSSVKEAFKASGIYPCDSTAIDKSQIVPASFIDPTDQNSTDTRDETAASTCEACGSFLTNPLVKCGLVPPSLASVLIPPPTKPLSKKPNKRLVTEGRVISGDEMLQQLKEKEETEKRKTEAREERLVVKGKRQVQKEQEDEMKKQKKMKRDLEREEKKRVKLQNAEKREAKKVSREEEKQKRKAAKMLNNLERESVQEERVCEQRESVARLAASMYVCGVCCVRGQVDDERRGVIWLGCDEERCERWYHDTCLTESEREYARDSLDDGSEWYCKVCKPWLYEEE